MLDIMLRLSDFGFEFSKNPVDVTPLSVQKTLFDYDFIMFDVNQHTLKKQ